MSMPTRDTIWDKIEIDGQIYDTLNRPLDSKTMQKIKEYKKENGGLFSSAPWITDSYKWSIVDKKLYLNDLTYLDKNDIDPNNKNRTDNTNIIQKIFQTDKLFAKWQNKDLKLLLNKKIEPTLSNRERVIMDIRVLKFKDGVLIETKNKKEEFTQKTLKDYVER
jgi:hypothetical protein